MNIQFFYDYISPYSYLASELLLREPELAERLDFTPVVFGSMLSHRGAKGPGEDPQQREIGLQDILMRAQLLEIPFRGTPTHPFNPLIALRSTCLVKDRDLRRRLTHAYFRLGWQESQALDDPEVLKRGLQELGIGQDPDAAGSDREARQLLKQNTRVAIEAGVTGVPSFLVEDVIFFGGDRIDLLKLYLEGKITLDREKLAALLATQGVQRVV